MSSLAELLRGTLPGSGMAEIAAPIIVNEAAKVATPATSVATVTPSISLQDGNVLNKISEYLHTTPVGVAKNSTSSETVTKTAEEQGTWDTFTEWLGTPRGFNNNLATAGSDAEVQSPESFPRWYEDVYEFGKEVYNAASDQEMGPTRRLGRYLSGTAESQVLYPIWDRHGNMMGLAPRTKEELAAAEEVRKQEFEAKHSQQARTVALVGESLFDPMGILLGGPIGKSVSVARNISTAAKAERAALAASGPAQRKELLALYAKEKGSILLPVAAIAGASMAWEGTNVALEQYNSVGEIDAEKVLERGGVSAGFAVALTGVLGVSMYGAGRLVNAIAKTGVKPEQVVTKVQEIGFAQRKALDEGLNHEEATKRGLRAVGLPTTLTDEGLEVSAAAKLAESKVDIPPDEALLAATKRSKTYVPDHVPDQTSYMIEVRKNGAVVHMAKAQSEETAIAKAQKMADATRTSVRIIDPRKADGVTVIRPKPLGEILPGQRGSISGKEAKPYFWEARKDGASVHLGDAGDETLARLKAQQAANETGSTVRLVDPNKADGVTLIRPQVTSTKIPLGQLMPKQGGFLGYRSKPPAPGHSVEPTRSVPGLISRIGAPLHTAMADIAPSLAERVRRTDFNVLARTDDYTQQALPWLAGFKKLPADTKSLVTKELSNGDYAAAEAALIASGNGQLVASLQKVRPLYDQMHADQVAAGLRVAKEANHYGRVVKDYAGLSKSLTGVERTAFDKALAQERSIKQRRLATEEEERVLSNVLRTSRGTPSGSTSAKSRKVDTITDKELPFYALADEALERNIETVARNVEIARMWGPGMVGDISNSVSQFETIGKLTRDAVMRGEITSQEQINVLHRMFDSAYGVKEPTNKVIQAYRNTVYTTMVAQMSTAIQNLTDLAYTAYRFGVPAATKAAVQQLTRRGVSLDDVYIKNAIAEIADRGFGAKVMDDAFRLSGFRALDRFAKGSMATAAKNFYGKTANTAEIHKKWDAAIGSPAAVDAAIASMKPGAQMNHDAKYMLVSELADFSPVLRSELPEAWMANPNARVLYTLHTYQLKQLDVVRREIFKTAKTDPNQAAKNLFKLATYLATAQVGTGWLIDFVRNRPLKPAEDHVAAGMLKMVSLSGYSIETNHLGLGDKQKPDFTGFVADVVLPPTGIFETPYDDLRSSGDKFNSLQLMPAYGRLAYDWFGGGVEATQKRVKSEKKAEQKQKREDALPEAYKQSRDKLKKTKDKLKKLTE